MASGADLLMEVGLPGTATTLAGSGYIAGSSTISVVSTTDWPTATGTAFAMDEVGTDGEQVEGSYREFAGKVSDATTIVEVVIQVGEDRDFNPGAGTRVYIPVSSTRENRLVSWGRAQHNLNGTHAAITAESFTLSGALNLPANSIEFADLLSTMFSGQLQTSTGGSAGNFSYANILGIKIFFGVIDAFATNNTKTITFPDSFFTTTPIALPAAGPVSGTGHVSAVIEQGGLSTSQVKVLLTAFEGSGTMPVQLFVIGK